MDTANPLAPDGQPPTDKSEAPPTQASFYKPETPEASSPATPEADGLNQIEQAPSNQGEAITWTASEFIAHNKSFVWYGGVVLSTLLLAGVAFVLTHDFIVAAVLLILGVAFSVYGSHQPRQLQYALSSTGLQIANKFLPFDNFRSFSLLDDGAFGSIVFAPLKRFGQSVTIYFDPTDGERIVDLLSHALPLEPRRQDPLDQLMRRIHF